MSLIATETNEEEAISTSSVAAASAANEMDSIDTNQQPSNDAAAAAAAITNDDDEQQQEEVTNNSEQGNDNHDEEQQQEEGDADETKDLSNNDTNTDSNNNAATDSLTNEEDQVVAEDEEKPNDDDDDEEQGEENEAAVAATSGVDYPLESTTTTTTATETVVNADKIEVPHQTNTDNASKNDELDPKEEVAAREADPETTEAVGADEEAAAQTSVTSTDASNETLDQQQRQEEVNEASTSKAEPEPTIGGDEKVVAVPQADDEDPNDDGSAVDATHDETTERQQQQQNKQDAAAAAATETIPAIVAEAVPKNVTPNEKKENDDASIQPLDDYSHAGAVFPVPTLIRQSNCNSVISEVGIEDHIRGNSVVGTPSAAKKSGIVTEQALPPVVDGNERDVEEGGGGKGAAAAAGITSADGDGDANNNTSDPRRRRRIVIFLILLVLALAGAVAGLTYALIRERNGKESSKSEDSGVLLATSSPSAPSVIIGLPRPSVAPSSPSQTAIPSTLPTTATPLPSGTPSATATTQSPSSSSPPSGILGRVDATRNWILERGYSSDESLSDPSSPQSLAMVFMVEDDDRLPNSLSFDEVAWMQRYVASVLYYAFNGENWTLQLNFLDHSIETCSWFSAVPSPGTGIEVAVGILCAEGNRINVIQIVGNNLSGSFPSELGLLTDLIAIRLEQNSLISGPIPDELQNLTLLEQFSCVYCSLSGTIPTWIGNGWSNLYLLGLTQNTMFGNLPESMATLTNLAILAIDGNILTGTLDVLQNIASLGVVYVEENDFTGTIDASFLAKADQLSQVDLSSNRFVGSVPVHLFELATMNILDLNGNQLTVFPTVTQETNEALRFLSLHDNLFTGTVPSTIGNLQALTHLDLTSTTFSGTMPEIIGSNLDNLSYLFLANTTFDSGPIPGSFQQLTKLIDWSLKSSSRTGTIPDWVTDLDSLVLLDLHLNQLSGALPARVGAMSNLEFLLLNQNDLSGEIPELTTATSLQILFLEGNDNLQGSLDTICSNDNISLLASAADCDAVSCPCCTTCCCATNDGDDCNQESYYLAQYNPQWEDGYQRVAGVYDFLDDK